MPDEGANLFEELMRFRPEGLTANGWAVKAGVSRTIWTDLKRHGNPSRKTLEKLLGAAGMSLAEFEALRIGQAGGVLATDEGLLADRSLSWRGSPLAPLPLLDTSIAREWDGAGSGIDVHQLDRSRVAGMVDRPAALGSDKNAYAIIMTGQSMWPRFRPGRRLLVSPSAKPVVGDDVLVELCEGGVLIKDYAGKTATGMELRQFNPDVRFAVATAEVVAIHKVMGEAL